MTGAPRERRQLVRFAFYRLDPVFRRLPAAEQRQHKEEFAATISAFAERVLLRSYSLVGVRGDADFMLWQVAEELDTLQALQTALNRTRLGAYLAVPYSYLAMTRRSIYEIRDAEPGHTGLVIRPSQARYLFVYPFVKTREWYALPMGERQAMMEEHIAVGRRFPSIRLNTTYSYGLDDQEFVVAFEGDDPAEFLDLVMALRESQASRYTLRDTPTFSCIQMPIADMLDALGGEAMGADAAPAPRADGLVAACALRDLPPGASRRVVARGEVVAVFNVGGRVFAIGNRCTHARASLADGTVDAATAVVTCPWHAGRFELATGRAIDGPPKAAVPVYPVRIEDGTVLLGVPEMTVAD
ncbi:MAG: chlorite dismutase family protein [Gemmatimonadetes bacterium]|nr:chlorite dismutase family protein [Gemmatimonadota bacterium]